jgi:hypothetical protein
MAIALATITIFDSISKLNVPGVAIKDLNEIPTAVDLRRPTLFPVPENAFSDFAVTRQSQGGAGTALMEARYNINYRFCCFPVGSGRGLFDIYDGFMERVVAILNAVLAADMVTGLIDIEEWYWSFGIVVDPAGVEFYGCDLSMRVMEFVN